MKIPGGSVEASTSMFLSWCSESNIVAPLLHLQVRRRDDGASDRYMTAKQSISGDDNDDYSELIRVPLNVCLKGTSLEEVADRLAFEKQQGEDSKWLPYLNMLPSKDDFQCMPMFWSEERVASVRDGGQLTAMMASMMTSSDSSSLDPWALACAHSRSNFLSDKSYAMTPLLDMLNHNPSIPTRAKIITNKFDEEDQTLALRTQKSVEKGQEVCISYGQLSNVETLCRYGFVEDENPANVEALIIPMLKKAPIYVTIYADGSIDTACKAGLRLEMATAQELQSLINNNNENNSSSSNDAVVIAAMKPISDRNELDAMSFLATYVLEAVEEAQESRERNPDDLLVASYLQSRVRVLKRALEKIETQFPGIEY